MLLSFKAIAIEMENMRKSQKLPDTTVPKLSTSNFKAFNTAFACSVRRQMSLAGMSLLYILQDREVGNYDAWWITREEKLHTCLKFS